MKQKTKKIIAKEIIILFFCFLITGLTWIGILIRNHHFNNKIERFNDSIAILDKKIDSLNLEIKKHKWDKYIVSDSSKTKCKRTELYYKLISSNKVTVTEIGTLGDFLDAIKDSLTTNQFYNNLINSKKLTVDDIGTFDKFYDSISLDFKNSTELNKAQQEKAIIVNQRLVCTNKIYTTNDTKDFLINFFIFLFALVYPIRFLILLLVWSIKTLKQ